MSERTTLTVDEVIGLLRICVSSTYFQYDGEFYKEIHGCAMGSPVSPIICNLYIEDFEQKALASATHPPSWWFRYVDDTNTKQKKVHKEEFLNHTD